MRLSYVFLQRKARVAGWTALSDSQHCSPSRAKPLRLPVAIIVTNQSPPVGDEPPLMTMECVPFPCSDNDACVPLLATVVSQLLMICMCAGRW